MWKEKKNEAVGSQQQTHDEPSELFYAEFRRVISD